jgi:hypothetical protein
MPPPPDLATAADENLAVHASWATASLPGARVRHAPDLVVVDSGLPCDTFNFVCRARLDDGNAGSRAREAVEFFRVSGHPFSWWLGPGYTPARLPEILADIGLTEAESEVAMGLDLRSLPDAAPATPGLRIIRVRTTAELEEFARLSALNWDPPDQQVLSYYHRAAPRLLSDDSPQWFYLGLVDGTPAATAEATMGGGVVGLYNISTRAPFRRRGIGLATTHGLLVAARAAGLSHAILQAAEAGVGVYGRLGFRGFGTVTEWKPPSGAGRV